MQHNKMFMFHVAVISKSYNNEKAKYIETY